LLAKTYPPESTFEPIHPATHGMTTSMVNPD